VTGKDSKVVFSIPGNTGIFATWAHSSLLENDKKILEEKAKCVQIIVTHFEQQESRFGWQGAVPGLWQLVRFTAEPDLSF
jgi:hypothetical protein